MAVLDIPALLEPISAGQPCGPDLDLEGDPDFMQAVARIEGVMPASYFTRDEEGRQQPFDRASIDFTAEIKTVTGLLDRSRDLRLLTLFTRLSALNRDLAGMASGVGAVAALLGSRWADVNPRGEDGDYGLRSAVLQALDDMAAVVLPLQHIPLAESRRFGSISFRSVMVAQGEATSSEGEAIDRPGIDRTLAECDLDDLRAKNAAIATILDAASSIYATMVSEASFEETVKLERLTALARRIAALLGPALEARDPGAARPASDSVAAPGDAAPDPRETMPSATATAVTTMAGAAAALGAVGRYLAAFEPSNPAEVLVRQTRSLVGKSFLDVLRILVPNHAEDARIGIGADRIVELSFGQLAAVEETTDGSGAGESPAAEDGEAAVVTAHVVTSRRQAVDLMQKVAAFYRAAEPSSPIPLLLERAVSTIERDFLSILKDVLPALVRRDTGYGS